MSHQGNSGPGPESSVSTALGESGGDHEILSGKKVPSMIHPVDKRGLRDPIAAALRRLHDETVAEPLPDDFLDLLAQIEEQRTAKP